MVSNISMFIDTMLEANYLDIYVVLHEVKLFLKSVFRPYSITPVIYFCRIKIQESCTFLYNNAIASTGIQYRPVFSFDPNLNK